jgi:hypothetical protein
MNWSRVAKPSLMALRSRWIEEEIYDPGFKPHSPMLSRQSQIPAFCGKMLNIHATVTPYSPGLQQRHAWLE